jgi:hypothetical protein
MPNNLMQLYQDAIAQSRDSANGLADATDRFKNFDANAGFESAVRGATGRAKRTFDLSLEGLKGSAVRNGRLNTGFFDEDAGRLYEQTQDNLNNTIGQYALQTQGQQLQANQAYLGAGQNQQQQYYDLLSGGLDRETAEGNARKARKASLLGGLASLAGTAIGAFAGGPPGAALGGRFGRSVGGAIAGDASYG